MNLFKNIGTSIVLLGLVLFFTVSGDGQDAGTKENEEIKEEETQKEEIKEEELQYTKGSLCGYCDYCKFCKLCDEDCPCDTSPSKPNCYMCKYCKFCYLCSAVCNTVCQPGGFIDRISASVINALPTHNTEEIDKDIGSVKHWIDKKKDEL